KEYLQGMGLEEASFRVMIYTRDPVRWMTSYLQQRVFMYDYKYQKEYDRLKDKRLPSLFREGIEKFANVFGEECVDVYSFEDAVTHEKGVVGHFLEKCGVSDSLVSKVKQVSTNESRSMFTMSFLAYLNERIPLLVKGKHNEERYRTDQNPTHLIRGNKFDLSVSEKNEVAE